MNASLLETSGPVNHFLLINNTLIKVQLRDTYRDSQLNELLYVIVVIVFYATALMTLIITQIKRQRRDGPEIDYYDEYLQRNSEVKQTCQVASNIIARQSHQPPPALATAAFAAAAAGTLLGRAPLERDEVTDNLSDDGGKSYWETDTGGVASNSLGGGSSGGFGSRIHYPRDKSPVLESIPDLEG